MGVPRIWLVTGSSSGFGLSMIKLALEKGDKVMATLRRPSDIDDLARKYSPTELCILKVDVTQPAEVANAFVEAKQRFGRIDVVFNNAGSFIVGEVEATPEAAARSLMDVNFWGAATVSREAVRFFREDNPPGLGGLLLNVSSISGTFPSPCAGYYTATKHALEGLTESLALELEPKWNIKVCIVAPGVFRTPVSAKGTTLPAHPAYVGTESTTEARKLLAASWDPQRPFRIGDVDKAVRKIYDVSELENPPMRLALGKDCLENTRVRAQQLTRDLDGYEKWSEDLLEDE